MKPADGIGPVRDDQTSRGPEQQQHVVGILVVYYPRYLERALREFSLLLERLAPHTTMIVVSNHPEMTVPSGPWLALRGSNDVGEFSGWQEGLDAFRPRLADAPAEAMYVFANDTFCHHRFWSEKERLAFRDAMRVSQCLGVPALVGPVDSDNVMYELHGVHTDRWVSTYLFGMQTSTLACLEWQIRLHREELECLVPGGAREADFFGHALSPPLRRHLSEWLFRQKRGWRHAAPLSAESAERLRDKARAILCEKSLSARVEALGGALVPMKRPRRRFQKLVRRALTLVRRGIPWW